MYSRLCSVCVCVCVCVRVHAYMCVCAFVQYVYMWKDAEGVFRWKQKFEEERNKK